MESSSSSNSEVLKDIALVIEDINHKKGVCLNEILNYVQKFNGVPESKKHELQTQIVRLLDEAEEKGLVLKSPILYKVSSYGKQCLSDRNSELVENDQIFRHSTTGDDNYDENTDDYTSDGDYDDNDSSSCGEGSTRQDDLEKICEHCHRTLNSNTADDNIEDIKTKLQSIRDYDWSSDDTGSYNRTNPSKTRTDYLQKNMNLDNMNTFDKMTSSLTQRNILQNDDLKPRRCCIRFKKCKTCGELMVGYKSNRSRITSNKKNNNQNGSDERKNCKYCEKQRKRKRRYSHSESSDTSTSSHRRRSDRNKSNHHDPDRSKTTGKNNPQKSPDDQKNSSKSTNDKTSSHNSNDNKRKESDNKQSQGSEKDEKTTDDLMYCNRSHRKRHKESYGKSNRSHRDNDRKKQRPDSNSDDDSKNSTSKKRKRSNTTPPPPFLDPTAKPGANGIERKVSNPSNPSLPYFPPRDANENEVVDFESTMRNENDII